MMDHLYREISMAFPGRVISHIDVCQESDTYRLLRVRFRGARSESILRSFLHKRSPMEALVETAIHDAEDLGLTLPYEQINNVLLTECKDIEATSADPVLVLRGAPVAKSVGLNSPPPSIEGCLLRGDDALAKLITRSEMDNRVNTFDEPTRIIGRRKTLYVGAIALFAIISGHQNAGSHTNDALARQQLMLALTQLKRH